MSIVFFERLKEARGDRTQAVFCKLIDVKQGTYSTWELGKYQPPFDKLTSIARLTNKTVGWLLGEGEAFRDRLRKARKEMGLSVKELADRINTHDFYITELENGKSFPTQGIVHKLAGILGVTAAYLNCDASTQQGADQPAAAPSTAPTPCANCGRLMALLESQAETIKNLSARLNRK